MGDAALKGRESIATAKILESPLIRKQLERLQEIVDEAQQKLDITIAHDVSILKAVGIVEAFLKKTKRVCYGGQAINAHLPEKLKFYDPKYDIPDYDFFTPEPDTDLKMLVDMLKKEGFEDIHKKPGVHDGTQKVYVNFVAIADITSIDSALYKKYSANAFIVSGIHYLHEDLLRMLMYMELSRPRGEVKRWTKVYERLLLLNSVKPIRRCTKRTPKIRNLPPKMREKLLKYIISEQKILAGAEVGFIYRSFREHAPISLEWILHTGGPILLFSRNLEEEGETLRTILGKRGVSLQKRDGYGEYIPSRMILRKNGKIVVCLIEEIACSSYNELPLNEFETLRVASLDTLIYLYLLLGLLTNETRTLGISLLCVAQRFIELSARIRASNYSRFPIFSIECAGHQKTFPSLLRERIARIKQQPASKTMRRQSSMVSNTAKSSNNGTRKNKFQNI